VDVCFEDGAFPSREVFPLSGRTGAKISSKLVGRAFCNGRCLALPLSNVRVSAGGEVASLRLCTNGILNSFLIILLHRSIRDVSARGGVLLFFVVHDLD
jgi:hypothetical protein